MIRSSFIFILFLAPFFFPYLFTLSLIAGAALLLPSAALGAGILIDLLYASSLHLPLGTISALLFVGIGFFMRTFIRTHVMSA